jgi:hypothetical protein
MKMHPLMRRVVAIKPHRYGTRHLVAGDEYEAPPRHAVALVAARKAQFASEKKTWARSLIDPQTASEFIDEVKPDEVTIDSLRLEATQLGINIDGRWGVARLQHEIDEARQR